MCKGKTMNLFYPYIFRKSGSKVSEYIRFV